MWNPFRKKEKEKTRPIKIDVRPIKPYVYIECEQDDFTVYVDWPKIDNSISQQQISQYVRDLTFAVLALSHSSPPIFNAFKSAIANNAILRKEVFFAKLAISHLDRDMNEINDLDNSDKEDFPVVNSRQMLGGDE